MACALEAFPAVFHFLVGLSPKPQNRNPLPDFQTQPRFLDAMYWAVVMEEVKEGALERFRVEALGSPSTLIIGSM